MASIYCLLMLGAMREALLLSHFTGVEMGQNRAASGGEKLTKIIPPAWNLVEKPVAPLREGDLEKVNFYGKKNSIVDRFSFWWKGLYKWRCPLAFRDKEFIGHHVSARLQVGTQQSSGKEMRILESPTWWMLKLELRCQEKEKSRGLWTHI